MPAKKKALKKRVKQGYDLSLIDRLIRAGMIFRAAKSMNNGTLQEYHHQYWEGAQGRNFHTRTHDRFSTYFEKYFKRTIDQLYDYVNSNPRQFDWICEIGTGNGMVLAYLANRFQTMPHFVGIDLNAEQIEENKSLNTDSRVTFVCARAQEWIKSYGRPNCIYLTNAGVFEYFSQKELESLLGFISTQFPPAAILIFEPVAEDHDLSSEKISKPHGAELSFSHNYPYLFQRAGLEIINSEEACVDGYRMLMLFAIT